MVRLDSKLRRPDRPRTALLKRTRHWRRVQSGRKRPQSKLIRGGLVCRHGHTERETHWAARHWRGAAHRGDFLRWRFRSQAVVLIGAEVDSLGTEVPRPLFVTARAFCGGPPTAASGVCAFFWSVSTSCPPFDCAFSLTVKLSPPQPPSVRSQPLPVTLPEPALHDTPFNSPCQRFS